MTIGQSYEIDDDVFDEIMEEQQQEIIDSDTSGDLSAADFGGGTTGDLRLTLYEMYSGMTEPTAVDMDLLTINNDPDCSLIETIYDMVLPLGYGFALLYFFLEFVDHATSGRGETDYKYMMWLFIKLVLVEEIIRHGKYLINVALEFGNWMLYKVSQIDFLATSLDGTDFQAEIIAAINELGFFQCLAHLPTALLCQIIMLNPAFMISLHAITRKLEIIIRCGCLPLALPNMFSEGTRSGGMRYLKKLLAVMLHGFMMYLIVAIAGSLSVSVHVSFEGLGIQSVLTTALYSFAAVGLISAGKTIVNDVFGV
ncbi:MAG: type IV secretion system protein [Lachnospiraceae bacterium]|nr:type IV secretion system protein [Lachnospiraceae bacterium]